jgi:hypothetical protein
VSWSKDSDDLRCLGVEAYDDESGYHVDIPQVSPCKKYLKMSKNIKKSHEEKKGPSTLPPDLRDLLFQ